MLYLDSDWRYKQNYTSRSVLHTMIWETSLQVKINKKPAVILLFGTLPWVHAPIGWQQGTQKHHLEVWDYVKYSRTFGQEKVSMFVSHAMVGLLSAKDRRVWRLSNGIINNDSLAQHSITLSCSLPNEHLSATQSTSSVPRV